MIASSAQCHDILPSIGLDFGGNVFRHFDGFDQNTSLRFDDREFDRFTGDIVHKQVVPDTRFEFVFGNEKSKIMSITT